MNISTKEFVAKTADGHIIKRGDILYYVENNILVGFKAWAWHNGKRIYPGKICPQYPIDWQWDMCGEYAGVYTKGAKNPHDYFILKCTYKSLEKARNVIIKRISKKIEEVKKPPKMVKSRFKPRQTERCLVSFISVKIVVRRGRRYAA